MTGACDMRPVQCPYSHIGCREPLVVRTLPEHLRGKTDHHLWLALMHIEVCVCVYGSMCVCVCVDSYEHALSKMEIVARARDVGVVCTSARVSHPRS